MTYLDKGKFDRRVGFVTPCSIQIGSRPGLPCPGPRGAEHMLNVEIYRRTGFLGAQNARGPSAGFSEGASPKPATRQRRSARLIIMPGIETYRLTGSNRIWPPVAVRWKTYVMKGLVAPRQNWRPMDHQPPFFCANSISWEGGCAI